MRHTITISENMEKRIKDLSKEFGGNVSKTIRYLLDMGAFVALSLEDEKEFFLKEKGSDQLIMVVFPGSSFNA